MSSAESADATVIFDPVPKAVARETDSEIRIAVGGAIVTCQKHQVGGYLELSGQRRRLPEED